MNDSNFKVEILAAYSLLKKRFFAELTDLTTLKVQNTRRRSHSFNMKHKKLEIQFIYISCLGFRISTAKVSWKIMPKRSLQKNPEKNSKNKKKLGEYIPEKFLIMNTNDSGQIGGAGRTRFGSYQWWAILCSAKD